MEWWKMSFPEKLYKMASENNAKSVQWNETGQSVIIDIPKFQEEFLKSGHFFKTYKMNSMIRQLNYYGFKNKTIAVNGHYLVCTHPSFKKDHPPEQIRSLRRRHNCKQSVKFGSETKDNYMYPEVKIKVESLDDSSSETLCVSDKTKMAFQDVAIKTENRGDFGRKFKAFVECMPVRGLRIDVINSARTKATQEIYNTEEQNLRNNFCYTTALSYLIASLQELKKHDIIDEVITTQSLNTYPQE